MPIDLVFEDNGPRTCVVRFGEGSRLPDELVDVARRCGAGFAQVVGIGGFQYARLAIFDAERRVYRFTLVESMPNHVLEVVGFAGNVACFSNGCYPHVHVVVARKPGEVYAGHLLEAVVKPFLELSVTSVRAPGILLEKAFGFRRGGVTSEPL